MKSTLFIISLIVSAGLQASTHPTLSTDCSFKKFKDERMASEREKFWIRDQDVHTHLFAKEKEYDRILADQIAECYGHAVTDELGQCKFSSLKLDNERLNLIASSSEGYHWSVSEALGAEIIHPAKREYMKGLAEQIKICFTTEHHLDEMSWQTFQTLWSTAELLEKESFLPPNTAVHGRRGGGRDSESRYTFTLNGLTLQSEWDEQKVQLVEISNRTTAFPSDDAWIKNKQCDIDCATLKSTNRDNCHLLDTNVSRGQRGDDPTKVTLSRCYGWDTHCQINTYYDKAVKPSVGFELDRQTFKCRYRP